MFHEGWEVAIGIASVIATGLIIYFVMIQTKHTQDSLELTRNEMRNRLRPWIGRLDLKRDGCTLIDGKRLLEKDLDTQKLKKSEVKEFHFKFFVQNYGQLPAQKLIIRSVVKEKELPTANELLDVDESPANILMPD